MNIEERLFGGNRVRWIATGTAGLHHFAGGPYTYSLFVIDDQRQLKPELQSYSVFVLDRPDGAHVRVLESDEELRQGDALQVEAAEATVAVAATAGGVVRLLVAGTKKASGYASGLKVTRGANLYRVAKPWGHELWINGQHPNYALKEIAIKSGTKTSLQYHHFKQETNVLFEGTARLHFKQNAWASSDSLRAEDVGAVDLESVSVVDVSPPTVHRLEALTDVLLYEVSTPHLDDVVRVQDDAGRPDGRISEEHRK